MYHQIRSRFVLRGGSSILRCFGVNVAPSLRNWDATGMAEPARRDRARAAVWRAVLAPPLPRNVGKAAAWTPRASVARPVARCWPSSPSCRRPFSSTAEVALHLRRPTFSRRAVPPCSPPRSPPCHGGWIEPTGAAQRPADGQVAAADAAPADEQPRSDEPRRSSTALVPGWTSRSCRQRSAGTCRPLR